MKTVFREGRSGDAEFKGAQTAGANVHGGRSRRRRER